jgi:AcrR family transcriptional regulator
VPERRRRKERKAYHHGDLRAALVQAALACIDEVGVERFTLREAARRAGVSPGAPYRHFADKDELLTAVAAECSQRLGAAMDAAFDEGAGDLLAHFRRSGVAYVRFAHEHPAHFRAMTHPSVAARRPLKAEVDAWMVDMSERLRKAQAEGLLAGFPVEHILLATGALVRGLGHLVSEDPRMKDLSRQEVDALAVALTEIVGLGILPRAPAAESTDGSGYDGGP